MSYIFNIPSTNDFDNLNSKRNILILFSNCVGVYISQIYNNSFKILWDNKKLPHSINIYSKKHYIIETFYVY